MASLHERLADARQTLLRAGIPADEAALDAEVLARHVLGMGPGPVLLHGPRTSSRRTSIAFRRWSPRRRPASRSPTSSATASSGASTSKSRRRCSSRGRRPSSSSKKPSGRAHGALPAHHRRGHRQRLHRHRARARVPVRAGDRHRHLPARARRRAPQCRCATTSSDRITFVKTDLLEGVEERADLIVSNPPYIPDSDAEGLQPEVARLRTRRRRCSVAADGLAVIRRLFATAAAPSCRRGLPRC